MRVQFLSDLHLESCGFDLKLNKEADILVLAGDITTYQTYDMFEKLLKDTKKIPTIYLFGNHEFYLANPTMEQTKKDIKHICSKYKNVHVLDDTWIDIDGVRFVGSTLWSDFQLPFFQGGFYGSDAYFAKELAGRNISDFYRIPDLTPDKAEVCHSHAIDTIALAKRCRTPVVVCTHFLPSAKSIDPQFKTSALNPYFASNCEHLMGDNVVAWIHGHTHSSHDYVLNGTHVVCNPRGYTEAENRQFDPLRVVDVG